MEERDEHQQAALQEAIQDSLIQIEYSACQDYIDTTLKNLAETVKQRGLERLVARPRPPRLQPQPVPSLPPVATPAVLPYPLRRRLSRPRGKSRGRGVFAGGECWRCAAGVVAPKAV